MALIAASERSKIALNQSKLTTITKTIGWSGELSEEPDVFGAVLGVVEYGVERGKLFQWDEGQDISPE